MLKIRDAQVRHFEHVASHQFEDEMVEHGHAFSPRLCSVIGNDQVRVAIGQAIARAETCRFTRRGPVRFFIEMMFLYGSGFDTDPQYAEFAEVLHGPGLDTWRADALHERVATYQERVAGPNNSFVWRALDVLSNVAQGSIQVSADSFESDMLHNFHSTFPQKASHITDENLTALIVAGREQAQVYGFQSDRAQAMLAILMFSFGHQCVRDPLYPWISNTLEDSRIVNAAARADRLERKARTWLSAVLGRRKELRT